MRKMGKIFRFLIPVIALVALVVFMTGAGRRERAKIEEHKALARQLFEAWNTGNMDLFDKLYAPNYVRHTVGAPKEIAELNREGLKQFALSLRKDYPDFRVTMDESIISPECDRCAGRCTFRGTHTSGAKVTMTQCWLAHHDGPNGKVLEEWIYQDWLGLLLQMGFKLVPPGGGGGK